MAWGRWGAHLGLLEGVTLGSTASKACRESSGQVRGGGPGGGGGGGRRWGAYLWVRTWLHSRGGCSRACPHAAERSAAVSEGLSPLCPGAPPPLGPTHLGMAPRGQRLSTFLTLQARPVPVLPQGGHPLSCGGTDKAPVKWDPALGTHGTLTSSHTSFSGHLCSRPRPPRPGGPPRASAGTCALRVRGDTSSP